MTHPSYKPCAICNFPILHETWHGQDVHGLCFLMEQCSMLPHFPKDLIGRAKSDIPLSDILSILALVVAIHESPDATMPLGWHRPSCPQTDHLPTASTSLSRNS